MSAKRPISNAPSLTEERHESNNSQTPYFTSFAHSQRLILHVLPIPNALFYTFWLTPTLILHALPHQISENCLMKAILAYPKQ